MNSLKLTIIAIFFTFISQAQNNDYSKLWKKVEAFENEGLPKSALKEVEAIEKLALKSDNKAQQIKTLLFKSKYALTLEEDAQLSIITDFKTAISKTETPTKNVLQNLLATLYWQYFNKNRYKFYNRTKTESKVDETDFRTWDLETLFNEIHRYYDASLNNGLILQQTPINQFDALIIKGDHDHLRPTVFDVLSHNALTFYKTTENNITKPTETFTINNSDYLKSATDFVQLKLSSPEKNASQFKALKTYQELINFHLKSKNHEALAIVNTERYHFVNDHCNISNKQELILNSLTKEQNNSNHPDALAIYNYEVANQFYIQGSTYNANQNTTHQFKLKEALNLCDQNIKNNPKSIGAKKSEYLKALILKQHLRIQNLSNVSVNTINKFLVNYKNISDLDFTVYKVSNQEIERFNKIYREDEKKAFIKKLKAYKNWSSTLKSENDYQSHSIELLLPRLDAGQYIIKANSKNKNVLAFATNSIQVTDLAYLESEDNEQKYVQVIHRKTGKPIPNAKVELQFFKHRTEIQSLSLSTNQKGIVAFKKANYNRHQYNIKLMHNGQTAYFNNHYINYYPYQENNNTSYQLFSFTDRSIYRPGQTVYFKSIALKTENNSSQVVENTKIEAILFNTNDEEVSKQSFTTNAYGSISGEFILPNNGLNGEYYIELESKNNNYFDDEIYFSVEEYKRPKFETTFLPVTETYKLNDSITVKGKANAFAGSSISNAKVVYKVTREVIYPIWNRWSRPAYQNSPSQEMAFGETTTNDKGEFDIQFKAIPDDLADAKNKPVFNYKVTADVTDINGETRSETTTVKVGFHALEASILVNNTINKLEKDHSITINTQNLNGQFTPAKGSLSVYKLQAPNRVLKAKTWQTPDYKQLSEKEYTELFPYDAYNNEHDSRNWVLGELAFTTDFNTEKETTINLPQLKKWQSGLYRIVLNTKDAFNQEVKAEVETTLFSTKDKTPADNKLFTAQLNQTEYAPNDEAELQLKTSADCLFVTIRVEKDQTVISEDIIELNKNTKTLKYPISTKDFGGFTIHYAYVFENTVTNQSLFVNVPYPNPKLYIETTTFRDKLQPGSDETWSFKITGENKEKATAEVLASMYDASLDEFKSHQWNFNPRRPRNNRSMYRNNGNHSFGLANFRVFQNYNYGRAYSFRQSRINWYGLGFGFSNIIVTDLGIRRKKDEITTAYQTVKVEESEMKVADSPNVVQSLAGKASGLQINQNENGVLGETRIVLRGNRSLSGKNQALIVVDGKIISAKYLVNLDPNQIASTNVLKGASGSALYGSQGANGVIVVTTKGSYVSNNQEDFTKVKIRKNLQETAFFFPKLSTDKNGNVSFNFTTPEALTQWNLNLLAHNKKGEFAQKRLQTVTQKELMVIPNAPRFLRQGDQIVISTKIANLSDKDLSGQAVLQLFDGLTGQSIDADLSNSNNQKAFSVSAKNNTQVSWLLNIPETVQAVQYKVIAKSGQFSDGEQNLLPVLTNRMLVTESLPMHIKTGETKTFVLDKLKTNTSKTLKHHKLSLEITSNPAWYAVQALPYLMEYPYQCNEQTFSRYYANALATHIANSNPRIQDVFKQWKNSDALLSNLEKNEELKSILIEETPWLRDAQSESEQKKRIALLFDLNKMKQELDGALLKLKNNQMTSGAWSWFGNYRENRYITQHIITGFGHLNKLNVFADSETSTNTAIGTQSRTEMIQKAIGYLDQEFLDEYNRLKRIKGINLKDDHLSMSQLYYLYMRSFYPNIKKSNAVKKASDYYTKQIGKYWLKRPLYAKGLMALISFRAEDKKTSTKILQSLKENSITSDELGMYWKENTNSYYWHQASIETQSLLIEAFSEIENDTKTIDNLKIWLLKNKQTNQWKTTKATTNAIYALLLQGSDWLSVNESVSVMVGKKPIPKEKLDQVNIEAGTGYFKTSWNANEIIPDLAEVSLTKKDKGIAWGSLYWQYFEDLDQITPAKTPLQLSKKLFLKTNTKTGEVISEIKSDTKLKVGDLIRVRIELRSDRTMEFVHLKDMRASGLEPTNVLSKYKYQDGLGYYESTKDASTNFFFDVLPKGIYVFEYDLRVNNAGNFSNGISSIQCMYAPEFTSHSEGVRVSIDTE